MGELSTLWKVMITVSGRVHCCWSTAYYELLITWFLLFSYDKFSLLPVLPALDPCDPCCLHCLCATSIWLICRVSLIAFSSWCLNSSTISSNWPGVNRITYWSQGVASLPHKCQPLSPPPDNIRVMVIVWRLRGNIVRTAPCWVVWHNVHSQHHTDVSSSYRSSRLGLSHWDPYAMHRGGCLELYYCNMVEWC